jgi:hypothetical protein
MKKMKKMKKSSAAEAVGCILAALWVGKRKSWSKAVIGDQQQERRGKGES